MLPIKEVPILYTMSLSSRFDHPRSPPAFSGELPGIGPRSSLLLLVS